jgi:hypothetical protein
VQPGGIARIDTPVSARDLAFAEDNDDIGTGAIEIGYHQVTLSPPLGL